MITHLTMNCHIIIKIIIMILIAMNTMYFISSYPVLCTTILIHLSTILQQTHLTCNITEVHYRPIHPTRLVSKTLETRHHSGQRRLTRNDDIRGTNNAQTQHGYRGYDGHWMSSLGIPQPFLVHALPAVQID